MIDTYLLILLAGILLVVVLQLVVLLRKTQVDLPAELLLRLDAVEQTSRAALQAAAKNEGSLDSVAQQIRGFAQTTGSGLETVRHSIDGKLAQAQVEAGAARNELNGALTAFRAELTAAVGALASESVKSRESLLESARVFETRIQERFETLTAKPWIRSRPTSTRNSA